VKNLLNLRFRNFLFLEVAHAAARRNRLENVHPKTTQIIKQTKDLFNAMTTKTREKAKKSFKAQQKRK
jgi:hypothetical protein